MSRVNILICGVGGQGQLTLAKLLGEAAVKCDKEVMIAETRGLSHRGGSVVVYVRIGNRVYAPLFDKADIILALELIEAVRNIKMFSHETLAIVNNEVIKPNIPNVNIPSKDKLIDALRKTTKNLFIVNASEEAKRAGSPKSVNMVILGFLVGLNILEEVGVSEGCLYNAFRESKYFKINANVKAFNRGLYLAKPLRKTTSHLWRY